PRPSSCSRTPRSSTCSRSPTFWVRPRRSRSATGGWSRCIYSPPSSISRFHWLPPMPCDGCSIVSPSFVEPRARMITISAVSKWYGPIQVLKDCSTEVAKGEVVVVCGPSGSGKSTLIKCVNGLEPFEKGKIVVDGIEVGGRGTNLPKLRARIGMVFQHFELFPHLTV